MKPAPFRALIYALAAALVALDSWGIWSDFRIYAGDRVKEHLVNISVFMALLHLLLCAAGFGALLLYNRYTDDVKIAHRSLARRQALIGFTAIVINAAVFYIVRK